MSDNGSLRHTPVQHEHDESTPYQHEGDPKCRPDNGPEVERPMASDGRPEKTEQIPPAAPENPVWESSFDEFGGTESIQVRERAASNPDSSSSAHVEAELENLSTK